MSDNKMTPAPNDFVDLSKVHPRMVSDKERDALMEQVTNRTRRYGQKTIDIRPTDEESSMVKLQNKRRFMLKMRVKILYIILKTKIRRVRK